MTKLTTCAVCAVLAAATSAGAAPPAEVTQMLRSMAGTWRCTGTAAGPDGTSVKLAGTRKVSAELGGVWARDVFEGMLGDGKAATRYALEAFTTFDPAAKKWRELVIDSTGASRTGTSDGMKDLKMEIDGEADDARGPVSVREHLDMTDLRKGAHAWAEASRDRGKTWTPLYDLTCKR